jgi:hypothetical protein
MRYDFYTNTLFTFPLSRLLLQHEHDARVCRSQLEPDIDQRRNKRPVHAPLGSVGDVPISVPRTTERPEATGIRRRHGESQAGDEQGSEEGGQGLGEVVVGALSCFY